MSELNVDNLNELESKLLDFDNLRKQFNELSTSCFEQLWTDFEASKDGETGEEFTNIYGLSNSSISKLAKQDPERVYRMIMFILESVSRSLLEMMQVYNLLIVKVLKEDNF